MATKQKTYNWGGITLIVKDVQLSDRSDGANPVSLSSTEIAYIDGLTAGTVSASKAVVVDSSKNISGFNAVTVRGPVGTGATGAGVLTLQTAELTVASGTSDQLGRIDFQAPLEADGTDAILVGASIAAVAGADFSTTSNQTDIVFLMGVSEAPTEKVRMSSAGLITSVGLTSTGAITGTGGIRMTPVAIPDATTYAVLAADSGKVHIFPDFTSSCTASLPTAAAGLTYEFWYGGAAADAHNFIIDSTGFFIGGVVHLDSDAQDTGDSVVTVFSNNSSNDILTLVTPSCGTIVKVACNGTNWYVTGQVVSVTAPTMGD